MTFSTCSITKLANARASATALPLEHAWNEMRPSGRSSGSVRFRASVPGTPADAAAGRQGPEGLLLALISKGEIVFNEKNSPKAQGERIELRLNYWEVLDLDK